MSTWERQPFPQCCANKAAVLLGMWLPADRHQARSKLLSAQEHVDTAWLVQLCVNREKQILSGLNKSHRGKVLHQLLIQPLAD